MDSVREGELANEVRKRLGKPAEERWSMRTGASGNAPGMRGRRPT
jgi:hypothetical protein